MAPTQRPYYRCFPSNFLSGCMMLSAEEKGVYRTLIDLMYDAWAPVDDSTVDRRQHLARVAGLSTRRFGTVRDQLIAHGKIYRTTEGHLSNGRFERERKALKMDSWDLVAQIEGEVSGNISEINTHLNAARPNENNALQPTRTRAKPESIVHSPDKTRPRSVQEEAEAVESALQKVCAALGVALSGAGVPISRHAWPMQLQVLMAEDDLDVDLDIVPVLQRAVSRPKFNADNVRSLRLFRQDFIAQRRSRAMHDHLAERAETTTVARAHAHTREDWVGYLIAFCKVGAWVRGDCGPSPCEPGCQAPRDLLLRARVNWTRQGNHPELVVVGNGFAPWKPDAKGLFPDVMEFAAIEPE